MASPADEERFRTGLRGAIDRQAASRRRVKQRRNRRWRVGVLSALAVALVLSVFVAFTSGMGWGVAVFLTLALCIPTFASRWKGEDPRDAENKRGWWGPGV